MTIEELIAELQELAKCGDFEVAHERADAALLRYIGDERVLDAFGDVGKWYA